MFKIVVEKGEPGQLVGQSFLSPRDLDEGMTFKVGREPSSDISLPADFVSSLHGEFVFHRDNLYFRDMRSTNGTTLMRNGEPDRPLDDEHGLAVQLRDQDRLVLGSDEASITLRIDLFVEADVADVEPVAGEASDDAGEVLAVTRLEKIHELEGRIAEDPLRASRIYRASQLMVSSLNLRIVCASACAAIFELLPSATNINLLLDQRPPSTETEAEDGAASAENADFVPFLSVDREGNDVSGERPSRKVVSQVIARRAAVILADAPSMDPSQSIIKAQIRSLIGAPLAVGERIIGIIQVDNRSSQGLFAADDLESLMVLARQMALAIENARLFQRVKVAEERLTGENTFLKKTEARRFKDIIGDSEPMRRVFGLIERVVDTPATILVTGETGTGKELIARAVHYRSQRHDKLFVAQNCSALPESLLESELFGHKKGAFTGADADKKGLFEIAHGGTIFLDEIGETSPALQAKLLRVLQESEIRPLGAMYPKRIDARVIAATNRQLEEEVKEGRFREDLYYRLNVFPIQLPPLRDRRDDISLLAEHFLRKFCKEYNRPLVHFSPEATLLMKSYPWPGNIRELENEVQRLVIYGFPGDLVLPEHLAPRLRQAQNLLNKASPPRGGLKQMMEEVERWILLDTLRSYDNNKTRAAEALEITREGLHKKLNRFGI
ncbi:MAG: sigma 54-interacting transcriptional regulator [Myxococcota bacterium]